MLAARMKAVQSLGSSKDPLMSSQFSINCECGTMRMVTASDAGGMKACVCGREIKVPRLSVLRKSAGKDPFESSSIDTVRRELRERENSIGQFCLHSGRPTQDTLWVTLICERKRVVTHKESDYDWRGIKLLSIMLGLMTLPITVFAFAFAKLWSDDTSKPEIEEFGHDRSVDLPLPISAEFHKSVSSKKLLQYVKKEALFQKIFKDYPDAYVQRS